MIFETEFLWFLVVLCVVSMFIRLHEASKGKFMKIERPGVNATAAVVSLIEAILLILVILT